MGVPDPACSIGAYCDDEAALRHEGPCHPVGMPQCRDQLVGRGVPEFGGPVPARRQYPARIRRENGRKQVTAITFDSGEEALALAGFTTIADFTHGVDELELSKAVFKSLAHVHYVAATGALLFDADGFGTGAAPVHFATLASHPTPASPHPTVTAGDFLFV